MSRVYDGFENDVLQYLRKSEITINSYEPKKTRENILLALLLVHLTYRLKVIVLCIFR